MNVCFDTSTLVAVLLEKHPHHALAFPHLKATRIRLRRILEFAPTIDRAARDTKNPRQVGVICGHRRNLTRADGHALEHDALGSTEVTASLHTLGKIGQITCRSFLAMSGEMASMPSPLSQLRCVTSVT